MMVDRASDQVCLFLSLRNIKHRNSGVVNTWVGTLPRSFSSLHSRASVCSVGTASRTPEGTKIRGRSSPFCEMAMMAHVLYVSKINSS